MNLPRYTPKHAASVWKLPPAIVHRAVNRGLPGVTTGEDGLPRIHGRVVEEHSLTASGQLRAQDGRYIDHAALGDEIERAERDNRAFDMAAERWS
jgi:hypothetical protein